MRVWNFVRTSFYRDSVTLMRLAHDLERLPGVARVAVTMGTAPNRAVLAEAGLLAPEGARARPVDLVVAVRADSEAAAQAARAAAERALAGEGAVDTAAGAAGAPPRTLATALVALPGASLAVISVPGLYAGLEARRALSAGLDVMIFSDNVPLETEVALKQEAAARGRLVMGPDCGTAILQGVPLGFANAVPAGRIGLVAASGTGLQEVSCIVAALGEGVSQAIGVGSRDLSDAVRAIAQERFEVVGSQLRLVSLEAQEPAVLEEYYGAFGAERDAAGSDLAWSVAVERPPISLPLRVQATRLGERTLVTRDGPLPLWRLVAGRDDTLVVLTIEGAA